ncbi:MAG: 30S ribosomal protein S2 [Chloroflexi bacterium]|nr:30S ribosomal protein S2 [Chloroflexota bacterium]
MKQLLEAGVHFGHQTRRWNPRMRTYIFVQRNGIHIIDLQQTQTMLARAADYVRMVVADGGKVLFVGTKKQAQEAIAEEAKRCRMFYVNQRWLGGTLTNFATIQSRIDHLVRLEDQRMRGEFLRMTKKEAMRLDREIERMNRLFAGIKEMTSMPQVMFVVDPTREKNAVAEARRVGVPLVAIVDTDGNPDIIDWPIPANDDAIRSIRLITSRMADAAVAGLADRGEFVTVEAPAPETPSPESYSFAPEEEANAPAAEEAAAVPGEVTT